MDIVHPGVDEDRTVLWCKSDAERDVSAACALCAARRDVVAAGGPLRNQHPSPAQIDVFEFVPDIEVRQLTESAPRQIYYPFTLHF